MKRHFINGETIAVEYYLKPTVFERLDEVARELRMKEFDEQITIALLHAIEEATRLEPLGN